MSRTEKMMAAIRYCEEMAWINSKAHEYYKETEGVDSREVCWFEKCAIEYRGLASRLKAWMKGGL